MNQDLIVSYYVKSTVAERAQRTANEKAAAN